ncbi:F-box incomplete domain containing protein [Pandoravirus salinus]|uniref:F-box incomplete domain containing protein n=1 Tax=Pandoravirus salinus TaxID=1349410 RepID=S4VZ98_9VIRU|nr:F-box incomplete domain [Pandoravirus salinus]AGO83367.1 F-box incomplete domain containing protein [Pandoravirus salinus]
MSWVLAATWDSLRQMMCTRRRAASGPSKRHVNTHTATDSVADAMRQPADSLLPPELWTVVLGLVESTPQERFICARVCRQWRCIVLGDKRSNAQQQRVGAQVCRLRLANDSIDRDDERLFEWAIVDATDSPLEDDVLFALWCRIAERDALGCAAVLCTVGQWPLACNVARCHCATDPPLTTVIDSEDNDYESTNLDCRRLVLIMTAVRSRSTKALSLLLAWGVSHTHRWVDDAVRRSLRRGHVDVLELLWSNNIKPHIPDSALCSYTNAWVIVAAASNKPASLAWVFEYVESDNCAYTVALIAAAGYGANDTLTWLCQRQYFGGFGIALVMAAGKGYACTVAVMETYAPGARIYAEAHATTLGDLIRKTKYYPLLDAHGKALLAPFL